MSKNLRSLNLRAAEYVVREEEFDGRKYLVVPVVALVETVVHASNSEFPELVTASEFSKVPFGWNGRPVFHGHPQVDGEYVSGNSPEVLESSQIGIVFNTVSEDGKLKMEAWVEIERAEKVAPELLERINAGEAIQISVGVSVAVEAIEGVKNGKKYKGKWTDLVPDHLALLPADEIGACSIDAGCGVRAATQGESQMSEKNGGVLNALRSLIGQAREAIRVSQASADMSSNDIKQKLADALRKLDPRVYYCDDYYPEKGEVIYSVYLDNGYKIYSRKYSLAENGDVTVSGDPVEVQPILSYEPVGGAPAAVTAATAAIEPTTAEAAPCGCQKHGAADAPSITAAEEKNMTKEEMKAKIDAMTDAQLAGVTLEAPAAAAVAPAAVVETPAVAPVVATAAAPALTADEREALNLGLKTLKARKTASIKALKDSGRCKITDEKLASMSQDELDNLVALAGVAEPADSEVSFGLNGARVATEGSDEGVEAPPDFTASLRASRSYKDQAAAK